MSHRLQVSLDATDLADLVRRKEVSPPELIDSFIQNCERLNPKLNAVVRVLEEESHKTAASGSSDRPFWGVPMLLKDSGISLAGVPTEYGSRYFKGYTRSYDSEITRRYKDAGFIIVGKANCSELGTSCSSETVATGSMRNPWDPRRIPGISSGGSAAAVASGMVPIAYATDAGGSIRGPASWCGLVGLKPTRGRTSYAPDMGESWLGLGTQHVVTRSVRDSAAVLDLTCGYMAGDPYVAPPPLGSYLSEVTSPPEKLRIGFSQVRVNGEHFPKETLAALNSTAKLLESLGHTIEEESPTYDRSLVGEIMGVASAYALTELVSARQRETGIEPSEHNLELANVMSLAKGRALTTSDLMQTYKKINTVARAFASFFDAVDIWLTPTMGDVAPPLGYLDSSSPDVDLLISRFSELYQFNSVYNISGLPAITLPLHSSTDGMPIGVMFGAGFGKEATLFRLSGQLERAKPWRKRHPKISC